ncbi:MAG: hypothetical protein KBD10_01015 [Candidatus Pacebacteria bacterium]|nr:hypothetical protein [Candidatus Paceibacterota bacterium]
MGNKNLIKIFFLIGVVITLLAVVSAFLFFGKGDDKEDIEKQQEQIKKSLSIDERAYGVIPENVSFTIVAGNFARGKLTDGNDGLEKDFFMIKIGDLWRVVEISNKPVSCERFARLGFPNVFIQDCKLSFSDAVTLSEIDSTLAEFFLSANNTNLKIIGIVDSIENTEDGQLITVSSGGETVQIKLSINEPKLAEGDLIVTSITPPNKNSSINDKKENNVYIAVNPVVVNEQDRDLFIDNPVVENNNSTSTINNPGNKLHKIDAPKSSAPPSYFFNVNDVDNSFVDIELDGSF